MKDSLGQNTEVGDIIAYSSMNTSGVSTAVVLRLTQNQIKTNVGHKAAGNFIVVTQQLLSNGLGHKVESLRNQYRKEMVFEVAAAKKPVTKWRYVIGRYGQLIKIGKLACNNQQQQAASYKEFRENVDELIVRTSNWNGKAYVESYTVEKRAGWYGYGYGEAAMLKLAEIKDFGLQKYIECEISPAEFQLALDSSKSQAACSLKASGIWKI